MDSVLRKLGLKKGESTKETDARKRLQKELFSFQKGLEYGFPHKPSSLGHDSSLGFLAIGTATGALYVYGKPGLQFTGQHVNSVPVNQITFLPEQARFLTLCSDGSLHLWEMNTKNGVASLDEIKTFKLDASQAKGIACFCLSSTGNEILLGTDGGGVNVVDLETFALTGKTFTLDILLEKASDDLKANPGQVQVILQHPKQADKFLVGFSRGVLVLVDAATSTVEQTYSVSQQLESVTFQKNGVEFVTAHADGSYAVWTTDESSKPKENITTPYGPFPCKAITKIVSVSATGGSFLFFAGGMPRASYGEKNTVSVVFGEKHVVFDLSSKVVDFLTVSTADTESTNESDLRSLVILAEEELVSVDLSSEDWQVQHLPYLVNIHSSPVSCMFHVDEVPQTFWDKLTSVGSPQTAAHSAKSFPINGGKVTVPDAVDKELLITGHEDGSVLFWNVSVPQFVLLYKLNTADFFVKDDHPSQAIDATEDAWPPFQKVGKFDSCCDSPRLRIEKIAFCKPSETLVVAGASGQVIVLKFSAEVSSAEQKATPVSVTDQSSAWNGPDALALKSEFKFSPGFQPVNFVQMNPPASCTALALNTEWQLFAVGSVFGFLVYDYLSNKTVYAKGTQVPHGGKHGVSRSKSFQMTFRESFRQLRKRGSSVEAKDHKPRIDSKPEDASKPEDDKKEGQASDEAAAAVEPKEDGPQESKKTTTPAEQTAEGTGAAEEAKPEDKKPEDAAAEAGAAQPAADVDSAEKLEPVGVKESEAGPEAIKHEGEDKTAAQGDVDEKSRDHSVTFAPSTPAKHSEQSGDVSVGSPLCAIRSLSFAETFVTNAQTHLPTLWVGTSGGQVLIYQFGFPAAEKRLEEEIQITLAKEIHLRHRAPVIAIFVVDRDGRPLSTDLSGGHRVLICSQEQLKIFSLPSLKAYNKYKVSLHHNEAKISQVAFSTFKSKSDEEYKEKDLVCLTNHGDVIVFSVPHLRPQLKAELSAEEGKLWEANSFALTDSGFGFYQPNPSQLEKFSLGAAGFAQLSCALELKEGMRPVEVAVEELPPVKEEEKADETEKTEEPAKTEEPEEKKETADEVASEASKAADEKQADEGVKSIPVIVGASGDGVLNESVAFGDITADSIKVHMTEDGAEMSMVVTCHDVIENKMVIRTTERTISDAEGVRTEKKTVVEEKSSRVESSIQEGVPPVTVGGD